MAEINETTICTLKESGAAWEGEKRHYGVMKNGKAFFVSSHCVRIERASERERQYYCSRRWKRIQCYSILWHMLDSEQNRAIQNEKVLIFEVKYDQLPLCTIHFIELDLGNVRSVSFSRLLVVRGTAMLEFLPLFGIISAIMLHLINSQCSLALHQHSFSIRNSVDATTTRDEKYLFFCVAETMEVSQ